VGDGRVLHVFPNYNTLVTEIRIQKNDMTAVIAHHVKWDEDFFEKVFTGN
jgi:hypothetical protein